MINLLIYYVKPQCTAHQCIYNLTIIIVISTLYATSIYSTSIISILLVLEYADGGEFDNI